MIINCKFENNHGSRGGAIHCHSYYSPKLTNCIFTGNSSRYGGGIHIDEGSPILTNCRFSGNSAVSWGGAVYCEETSSPTIRNCLIIGNKAGDDGGGIAITDGSDAIIENCTISDNIANDKGGGIYCPDRMTVSNSILWGNYPDQITQNYRIVINYSDVEGGWSDVGNFHADPCFVDAGYWDANGTPQDANDDFWVDGDYRLLWDSPCINAGDPDYVSEPNDTDLDGGLRVINSRIDMGAYEFLRAPQIIYVDADATGANDGSSWADAYNFLQDALADANASAKPIDIRVAQGVYKPDQGAGITPGDRTATFQLIRGVALKGGYTGFGEKDPNARDINLYETILSGDLNGNDVEVNDPCDLENEPTRAENSYHVVIASETNETAVLDGFTITGGNANGPRPNSLGGGIYSYSSSPTIMNCTISGNSSVRNAGGGIRNHGTGMYHHLNCNPTIINCTISRNYGGGIKSSGSPTLINSQINRNDGGCGMINGLGNPTLINCTISGNNAGGWDSCDSYSTLINCMFVGNSSDWNAGAWFSVDSDSVLVNCVFVGNSARNEGGGIYSMSDYSMTLTNCILWSNRDKGGMDASAQIYDRDSINYCCIQGWTGDLGGIGNIDEDPCFVSPGYWDSKGLWIDGDYHLLHGSPCIDAGDPTYIAGPNETDFDGRPRVLDGDNDGLLVVDMGAYEYRLAISAEVRIIPKTINLASKGKWITTYIWLPEGYNVADIELNSVFLEDEIQPEQFSADQQKQVAIAKFNREDVQSALEAGDFELTITGRLNDGTSFEATDIIRVIDKGKIQ
jgi:parallel beta-helix repeat protein/predicted outer membrane repeat protein